MELKRERAYEKIRDAITYGELKPGERVVEQAISEKFDLGRTPIRKALRRLQAEGYVEVSPNKGAVIRKVSINELENTFDILAVLESYAVELATVSITEKREKKLRNITKYFKEAIKANNYRKWFQYNAQFHEYLWERSGNPILSAEINQLRSRTYRSRAMIPTLIGNADKYIKEHENILMFIGKV